MPTDKEEVKKPEVTDPAAQGAPDNNCTEQEKGSCGCGCIMPPLEKE